MRSLTSIFAGRAGMHQVRTGLVFGCLVTLAGCVSSGTKVTPEQLSAFVPGKTTEAEVIASLGAPTNAMTGPDGGKTDMWMYTSMHATAVPFVPIVGSLAGGAKNDSSMVTLLFTPDGVLKSKTSSTGSNDIHTGLLNQ
jgi:hypothetical protein